MASRYETRSSYTQSQARDLIDRLSEDEGMRAKLEAKGLTASRSPSGLFAKFLAFGAMPVQLKDRK